MYISKKCKETLNLSRGCIRVYVHAHCYLQHIFVYLFKMYHPAFVQHFHQINFLVMIRALTNVFEHVRVQAWVLFENHLTARFSTERLLGSIIQFALQSINSSWWFSKQFLRVYLGSVQFLFYWLHKAVFVLKSGTVKLNFRFFVYAVCILLSPFPTIYL